MEEPSPNLDQATYWTQSAGPTWVELNDELDRQIGSLGAAAMAALAPMPGERIIDIGCGCGQTVLALAEAAGAGVAQFLEADAQVCAFDPAAAAAVMPTEEAQAETP
jgi:ubiquinone/menaquinone biosynthesis C-methylase UbiE